MRGYAYLMSGSTTSITRLLEQAGTTYARQAGFTLREQFDGLDLTGADIYLREAQNVWPWAQPYFDDRGLTTARDLGLPEELSEQLSA